MDEIGKFKIIEYVGAGCFGEVYRVYDTLLSVERAIKIIKIKNPEEFIVAINEARILERCRHGNIVDIKEINIHDIDGSFYPVITTEYLKNGSAQGYLEKNFVTVQKSIQIISEVLSGLDHAHSQWILHRDIKPGNILFSDNWIAKLSDFWLAYGLAHQEFNFVGYNAHLPPEVLQNIAQDELSDLYSIGITLHRLLNNESTLPLEFLNNIEWLNALQKEKFPERIYQPYIPLQITSLVKKSIRANRDKRFQSCLEFRQALQRIPLAIEWFPIDTDNWQGNYRKDIFELKLYLRNAKYFIDFKCNWRRVNSKCWAAIPTEREARDIFFKTIQQTTISIL